MRPRVQRLQLEGSNAEILKNMLDNSGMCFVVSVYHARVLPHVLSRGVYRWGNGSECISTLDEENRPDGFMPTSGVRLRAGFSCARMQGVLVRGLRG